MAKHDAGRPRRGRPRASGRARPPMVNATDARRRDRHHGRPHADHVRARRAVRSTYARSTTGHWVAAVDGGFLSVANNQVRCCASTPRSRTRATRRGQAPARGAQGTTGARRPRGADRASVRADAPAIRWRTPRPNRALARPGWSDGCRCGSGCSMQPVSCSVWSCSTASPSSSAAACSRATAEPSNSATASGPKGPGAVGFSGSAATPVTTSSGSASSRSRRGPSGSGDGRDLTYVGRREPTGWSRCRCTPTTWWSAAPRPTGPLELAMGPGSLTGFQAWLEAGPPGPTQQL